MNAKASHPRWLVAAIYADGKIGDKSKVVKAATADDAAREFLRTCSVLALKRGVVVGVWRLGNFPGQYHAQYDGEPLTESHGATDAQLVVRSIGNPSLDAAHRPVSAADSPFARTTP